MHIVVLATILIVLIVFASRAGTMFVLEVRNGVLRVTRGRPPARLMSDFRDAVQHVNRCTIKGRKSGRRIQLSFSGQIDEGTAQRLRNILGVHQR